MRKLRLRIWKFFAKATQLVGKEVRIQIHSATDRPSILDGPRLQACCGAQWGPSLANAMQSIWLRHGRNPEISGGPP